MSDDTIFLIVSAFVAGFVSVVITTGPAGFLALKNALTGRYSERFLFFRGQGS